jgi:hypothetical protein
MQRIKKAKTDAVNMMEHAKADMENELNCGNRRV